MSRCWLLIVAGILPLLQTSVAESAGDESQQVAKLIRDLSEGNYKARNAAEEELKKLSRATLPVLQPHTESRDPEVRERIRNVVEFIRTDPGHIPEKCFAFDPVPDQGRDATWQKWRNGLHQWETAATACAKNLDGQAGAAGSFAQSFVPRCQTIQAVKLKVYPIGNGSGWLRLDVCEDDEGRPGKYVLGRSWVRVERVSPISHNTFTVFDLPVMTVNETAMYWLCLAEFPDVGSNRGNITNHGFSNENPYADGLEWRYGSQPSPEMDAIFTVFSKADKPPLMRPATEEELKTLPPASARTIEWILPAGRRGFIHRGMMIVD